MFVVLVETLAGERVSRSLKQCQTSNLKQEASCLFANGMKHVLLCSVNVTTKSFGHGFDGCQNLFRNSEKECLYIVQFSPALG